MPNYLDVIDANQFWSAPESDIFTLPIVAVALGVGRNKMCQIPVIPIMINKRKCYRKSDILDWALAEQEKGKDSLLLKLKSQNTFIGRYEKSKSQFYDYYLSRSSNSYYRPSNGIKETKHDKHWRLLREWEDIRQELNTCRNDEKLNRLIEIAWTIREQFVKLRMGLPHGIELGNWWFAENLTEAKRGRVKESIRWLQEELKYIEAHGRPSPSSIDFMGDEFEMGNINDEIESLKKELEQLKAELDEIS